jgi:hypothetical protein
LPARVYGWGENDFDDGLLLTHLGELGLALGLPIAHRASDENALSGYIGTSGLFPPATGRSLVIPFFYANVEGQSIEGALALQRLPAQGTALPGLILEPRLPSQLPLTFPLGDSARLDVRAGTNLGTRFGITLRPPAQVDVRYPFAPGTPLPAAGVGIAFTYAPPAPVVRRRSRRRMDSRARGGVAAISTNSVPPQQVQTCRACAGHPGRRRRLPAQHHRQYAGRNRGAARLEWSQEHASLQSSAVRGDIARIAAWPGARRQRHIEDRSRPRSGAIKPDWALIADSRPALVHDRQDRAAGAVVLNGN